MKPKKPPRLSLARLSDELGVTALWKTGPDAWLIILGRSARMFAYRATGIVLALFFSELGLSDSRIGLFMTLTVAGDVFLSLATALVADRIGRRRVMFLGAAMMVLSGVVFALSDNFWVLLAGAVVGIMSATGGDVGPFRAVEESTLSHITNPTTRADVMSWYVVAASVGSALGAEFGGRLVDALLGRNWAELDAFHAVFSVYLVMGILNMGCALLMSARCEIDPTEFDKKRPEMEEAEGLLDEEGEEEEGGGGWGEEIRQRATQKKQARKEDKSKNKSFFSAISAETRSVMYIFWLLMAVDAGAESMVNVSLTNYYFARKFSLAKSTLGDIASAGYFIAAVCSVFVAPLAKRLGLIVTMVCTRLPSSVSMMLFPFPRSLWLAVALYFVRIGPNKMDMAPRAAFVAGVARPEERTAVVGITTTVRTLAGTVGPSLTGWLAGNGLFWVAFVAAGAMRAAYDLGLFVMFVNFKLHKHEQGGEGASSGTGEGDEESLELQTRERQVKA